MTDNARDQDDRDVKAALQATRQATTLAHDEVVLKAARRVAEKRHRAAKRRMSGWLRALAVIAPVLAVAVFVAFRQFPLPADDTEILRGGDVATVPSNDSVLASAPTTLVWPAQRGAERYRVILRDADARVIWRSAWQSATELDASTPLPALGAGEYFWSVALNDELGAELGPYRFSIR